MTDSGPRIFGFGGFLRVVAQACVRRFLKNGNCMMKSQNCCNTGLAVAVLSTVRTCGRGGKPQLPSTTTKRPSISQSGRAVMPNPASTELQRLS